MINYATYRIDNKISNELNDTFDSTGFISTSVVDFSLLKSLFTTLFSIETLQIQFYNFLGRDTKKGIQNHNISQNGQDDEGKSAFFIQLVDRFVNSFDILFPRDFKIYI
jgi:hypothetical protein